MKTICCSYIIHIFALIHAAIVLLCEHLAISDELVLTVATISMIAILAIRKGQNMGTIAACVIAGNILGFVIGTYGAELLANIVPGNILHALTSMATTEIIGFGSLLLFNTIGRGSHAKNNLWMPNLIPMLLMLGLLLIVRVIYSNIFGGMLSEEAVNLSLRLPLLQ